MALVGAARNAALLALVIAQLTRLSAQQGVLASDSFNDTPGAMNGIAGGNGWSGGWQIQNGSTAVPGYNIATAQPLAFPGGSTAGPYAIGGVGWQNAGRALDTTSTSAFASYLNNGLIGVSGQTLYFGLLMRVDTANVDSVTATLHAGGSPAWYVTSPAVAVGYFGSASTANGTPFWSCQVNGSVLQSAVPIIVGQSALLVVRVEFGATSKVSFYVNPPSSGLPGTPNATATTASSLAFRSLAYYGGSGANQSSIDEIRLASTYASLIGNASAAPPAVPANLAGVGGNAQASLSWGAVNGATSYQVWRSTTAAAGMVATVSTNSYVNNGLSNGTAYTYYVIAVGPGGASAPSASVVVVPQTAPHPLLGTNLAAVADYSRELPFVDVFKMARPWIPQQTGQPWGQGPALALDANGWITSLQPGQYAETILMDNALDDQAHYPIGQYTLLYDGQGTIAFDLQSATIVSQSQGQIIVNVPAGGNGVYLMVTATNAGNPIRNIRFIMPGYASSYQTQPFNPAFVQSLQGFRALRFMEWALINGSAVQQWTDRPLTTDYTWMLRGVPLEIQIELANQLGLPPWFNIPAMASDNYVQQFASLVNSQLHSNLTFYLEYSNETWNSAFSQHAYVQSQGLALGLNTDPTVAAADYTAYRAVQIFGLAKAQLHAPSRMIRVIASQAANWWLSEQTLLFQKAYQQADVLASAPYFNCSDATTGGFGVLGDPSTAAQVAAMTVDQIIDIELQHINGCALQEIESNAGLAREYGVKLAAYEGGQSLVGYGGAENNSTLTSLFEAANRSPRMTSLYATYLQNWVAAGGDLFLHFTDVQAYTKWGSWGAMEYLGEPAASAPKYEALFQFASQHK
jgi:hypothetical protein